MEERGETIPQAYDRRLECQVSDVMELGARNFIGLLYYSLDCDSIDSNQYIDHRPLKRHNRRTYSF